MTCSEYSIPLSSFPFPRSLVPPFPRSPVPSFPRSLVPSFRGAPLPKFPCRGIIASKPTRLRRRDTKGESAAAVLTGTKIFTPRAPCFIPSSGISRRSCFIGQPSRFQRVTSAMVNQLQRVTFP